VAVLEIMLHDGSDTLLTLDIGDADVSRHWVGQIIWHMPRVVATAEVGPMSTTCVATVVSGDHERDETTLAIVGTTVRGSPLQRRSAGFAE